jgi:phosphatidylglycerol:prolipoprotein diacylglycerol transferase
MTWIILGVILGGRLGFVIFYQPAYFLANPGQILFLWQGGMSFHGGFLGVVLALILFCWRNRIPFLGCTDVIAWTVPVPIFFVRIANFINAELWGRPTELPWGVIFPGLSAQSCANVGEFCARHPSQIYEALLEGLVLGLVLAWLVWRRHALRFPGLVTGAFLAGYGLARCLVEFVRQPDAQFVSPGNPLGLAFHIDGYGLTMGQTLSLPMIAVGVFLIWRSRRPRTGEAAA